MLRITLAPDDRERLGAPEVLEFDAARLMALEAIALQKVTGWRPPEWWESFRQQDAAAMVALVWMALARAGVKIRFSELDFDLFGIAFLTDDDDEDEEATPGPKAEGPTSPPDSTSTDGPSPTTSESAPGSYLS